MGYWSKFKPIGAVAVSVYLLLAFLPLVMWFFSPQHVTDIMFGFTLYSLITLMIYVWEPFFLVYIFSLVLLPVFYVAVASGLERKSRIAWTLALISNLLTISANIIWIRVTNGTDPRSYGMEAGLVFNIVALIMLVLYWFTIIREDASK